MTGPRALGGALTACLVLLAREGRALPRENELQVHMILVAGQARLDLEPALVRDAEVEAYLEGVLCRLVRDQARTATLQLTVRVMDATTSNAFSLPDGGVYVTAGLLASLDDEAQLATLLGHEISHALARDSLREARSLDRSAIVAMATLGIGLVPAFAWYAGASRDREREADARGIRLMATAGYDVREAARMFEHLGELSREEDVSEPGWMGDHPRIAERVDAARKAAAAFPASGTEVGAERYRAAMVPVLRRAGRLALAAGRMERAERTARALLTAAPQDPSGWVLLGDVARLGTAGLAEAADRYRRALALDPACAEARRALGLTLLRAGDREGARTALARYLELRPDAVDRAFTEADLKALEGPPP